MPANVAEMNRVMMDGIRLAIRIPVMTGTINSHKEIWKVSLSEAEYMAIWSVAVASCAKPAMVKIVSVMIMDGTVVIIIYLICLNKGVSVTEEARTVVSDSGDILSPK